MVASLACETGIAPSDLMAETPEMLHTMLEYVHWRNEQQRKANRRGRRVVDPLL